MHHSTGDKECSGSNDSNHSGRKQGEIEEITEKLENHRITSLELGAGARIELAATADNAVMLPLHHPAESEHAFQRLEQEAAKGIGKASNHAVFELVKGIE